MSVMERLLSIKLIDSREKQGMYMDEIGITAKMKLLPEREENRDKSIPQTER